MAVTGPGGTGAGRILDYQTDEQLRVLRKLSPPLGTFNQVKKSGIRVGLDMDFNEQQVALFTWADQETGSCNLIARAGTGKSTTIVELAKRLPSNQKIFLGAFNKSIAEELKAKITRPNVMASTMHSLGFQLWRSIAKGKSEIDAKKVAGIVKRMNLFPFDTKTRGILISAVEYAQQAGFGLRGLDYTEDANWTQIFDHYDLWDELTGSVSPERILKACSEVYDESLTMCQEKDPIINFNEMVIAPLLFSDGPQPMYDWVLGDEWQDANFVRRKLMAHVLKPGGRAVFVGDNFQSIYGFAGAAVDSLDMTKKEFGCIELPLSITYRCPKSVVTLAQTLVPDIQAHESAPEGVVREIKDAKFWEEDFRETDVILCRNTRPLIGVAKRLRKMGVPCVVEGANGKSLIALASRWGEDIQIGQMEKHLHEYVGMQIAKWEAKNRLDKSEGIQERRDCLLDIASELEEFDSVKNLVKHIERMFGEQFGEDTRRILRLCTIHRVKGREWDRVFLLGRNLYMPSKWAKKDWEQFQENCLQYVAWTRTKRELVEVVCRARKNAETPEWWEL